MVILFQGVDQRRQGGDVLVELVYPLFQVGYVILEVVESLLKVFLSGRQQENGQQGDQNQSYAFHDGVSYFFFLYRMVTMAVFMVP